MVLQFAASFHCLVEEWKDCEELRPKPKEKLIFVDKKSEESRVVCGSRQVSVYEMWKRKQIHEDVLDQHSCQKVWENGEDAIWEVMTWSENGQAGRGSAVVQKVFGICEAKNGTETMKLLQTGTDGHQRIWQMLKRIQTLEEGRVPVKEAKNWRMNEENFLSRLRKRRWESFVSVEAFEIFSHGRD